MATGKPAGKPAGKPTGKLKDAEALAMYKDIIDRELIMDVIDYGDVPCLRGLHVVARSGDVDTAHTLIRKRADVNFRTAKGLTPLHYAVLSARVQMVQVLLMYGASVNAFSLNDGRTPLYMAVERGNVDVAEVLLEHGALSSIEAFNGDTAKDIAEYNNFHRVLRLIDDYDNGHAPVHANTNQVFRASLNPEEGAKTCEKTPTSPDINRTSSPMFGSATDHGEETDINTDTTSLLSGT